MSAVGVLAILISKVLQKARELSAKLFDIEQIPPQISKQEPAQKLAEKEMPSKPNIPLKPVMSVEAAAYPKLVKIYKELKRQNEIIFEAEKVCNALELERDDLKEFARFTKKGELQNKIDCKNEEINILKIGLSGIVKRHGFHTVHNFQKAYAVAKTAYADYWDKTDKRNESYGENAQKQEKESVYKWLKNYQSEKTDRQLKQTSKSSDRGARQCSSVYNLC